MNVRKWVAMDEFPAPVETEKVVPVETTAPPPPTPNSAITDESLLVPRLPELPPNPTFVFHNKLPKSGSTTMKYIADYLQDKNNFKMDYAPPCFHPPCNAKSGSSLR